MIREKVGPAVLHVYPDGSAVFQDDETTIHRAVETFNSRVDYRIQDLKMADVWPFYSYLRKYLSHRFGSTIISKLITIAFQRGVLQCCTIIITPVVFFVHP